MISNLARVVPTFRHIQTLLYQQLIVLRSHQTQFMSDLPVNWPLISPEVAV
jgi:hypothetical protein